MKPLISSGSRWWASPSTVYVLYAYLSQKLLREAKVWSQLDHPNITPFYGVCFDLGLLSAPCLISPYFKHGNVTKYLERHLNANRMQLVSIFCMEMSSLYNLAQVHQVAAGLAYLHAHGIIHGDMKSVGSRILYVDVPAFIYPVPL